MEDCSWRTSCGRLLVEDCLHLVLVAFSLITSPGLNITGSQDGIINDTQGVLPLAFFITEKMLDFEIIHLLQKS